MTQKEDAERTQAFPVSKELIEAIQTYGDLRADRASNTAEKLGEVVLMIRAALDASAEPVGSLRVEYFRGQKGMTNTYFDYYGDLPEGSHELFTRPAASKHQGAESGRAVDLKDEIVECVESAIRDANRGADTYTASLIATDAILGLLAAQPQQPDSEAPENVIADTANSNNARDAERYRHLRRNATSRFGRQPNDEEFDAMIDVAIEKESK